MIVEGFLMEEEDRIVKCGCNVKLYIVFKNIDFGIYSMFIFFEVVLGYFYLVGELDCL